MGFFDTEVKITLGHDDMVNIRANPQGYTAFISDLVRPYFDNWEYIKRDFPGRFSDETDKQSLNNVRPGNGILSNMKWVGPVGQVQYFTVSVVIDETIQ